MERELIGVAETAILLGYSKSNIKRLARAGELPELTKISGRRIFRREDVEAFRDQMEKRRAAKAVA